MRWLIILFLASSLNMCHVTSTFMTMANMLSNVGRQSYSHSGGGGGNYGSTSYNSYANKPSIGRLIGDKIDGVLAFKGLLLGPMMNMATSLMSNKYSTMSYFNGGGGSYGGTTTSGGYGGIQAGGGGGYGAGQISGGGYGAGQISGGHTSGSNYGGGHASGGSYGVGQTSGGSYGGGHAVSGTYGGSNAGHGVGGIGSYTNSVGSPSVYVSSGGGGSYGRTQSHSGGSSASYSTNNVKYIRGNKVPAKVRYASSPVVYEDDKKRYVGSVSDDLAEEDYYSAESRYPQEISADAIINEAPLNEDRMADEEYGQRLATDISIIPYSQTGEVNIGIKEF